MPDKFLILPAADCDANGLPTTLDNAVIDDTDLTGLTNGTTYRALVLTDPSDPFTPVLSSSAPVIAGPPILSGTAIQGQTLTAVLQGVTGNPTPTRALQWLRDGVAITGATSLSYVLQAADVGAVISIRHTETNSAGSDVETSAGTAEVGPLAVTPTIEIGSGGHNTETNSIDLDINMQVGGNGLIVVALWDDTKSSGTPPTVNSAGEVAGNFEQQPENIASPGGNIQVRVQYATPTTANRMRIWAINANDVVSSVPLDVPFSPAALATPVTLAAVTSWPKGQINSGAPGTETGKITQAGTYLLSIGHIVNGSDIVTAISGAGLTVTNHVRVAHAQGGILNEVFEIVATGAATINYEKSGSSITYASGWTLQRVTGGEIASVVADHASVSSALDASVTLPDLLASDATLAVATVRAGNAGTGFQWGVGASDYTNDDQLANQLIGTSHRIGVAGKTQTLEEDFTVRVTSDATTSSPKMLVTALRLVPA
ncbi:hypothetical protein [Tropicimonas sp. S265A]|uniref:hypothetical protein n=1 Tax=Tropicimonas sp. S265A TaxID=3415134 RepID=UPI003C7C064E